MSPEEQNMQTVSVRVLPALKEYLCAVNQGSDTIIPNRESRLWGLIKMHLDLVPPDFKPTPVTGHQDCIRIAIYNSHRKQWNHPSRRILKTNTLWRDYLTEAGQKVVADYLTRYMKQSFRCYMAGALKNNPNLTIRDGILSFCELHKVNMDVITYEMLRKDWFRFRRRNPAGSYVVPIENKDF